MPSWSIGRAENEKLTVNVLSKATKDKNFAYDSVPSQIHIRVGGFEGRIEATLPIDDLVHFRDRLVALHHNLKGTAELSQIMERQLELKLDVNQRGHYIVSGTLTDNVTNGNKLKFEMSGDQTDLAQTINELNQVIETCRN